MGIESAGRWGNRTDLNRRRDSDKAEDPTEEMTDADRAKVLAKSEHAPAETPVEQVRSGESLREKIQRRIREQQATPAAEAPKEAEPTVEENPQFKDAIGYVEALRDWGPQLRTVIDNNLDTPDFAAGQVEPSILEVLQSHMEAQGFDSLVSSAKDLGNQWFDAAQTRLDALQQDPNLSISDKTEVRKAMTNLSRANRQFKNPSINQAAL